MLLTSVITLLPLAVLFRELRNGFYVAHLAVVFATGWWLGTAYRPMPLFSSAAVFYTLAAHLVSITIITFCAYGYDKRAAKYGRWRIPEATLHVFMLLGGTLGAIAGQKFFRHKTKKQSFRFVFWMLLIVQISLLLAVKNGWLFW